MIVYFSGESINVNLTTNKDCVSCYSDIIVITNIAFLIAINAIYVKLVLLLGFILDF